MLASLEDIKETNIIMSTAPILMDLVAEYIPDNKNNFNHS